MRRPRTLSEAARAWDEAFEAYVKETEDVERKRDLKKAWDQAHADWERLVGEPARCADHRAS